MGSARQTPRERALGWGACWSARRASTMIAPIVANHPGGRMQVREGMSDVVLTVGPRHTLREAAEAMCRRNVGAAIVLDPEAPGPGVITERDLLRSVAAGQEPDAERVADHLTGNLTFASPEWSLEQAGGGDGAGRLSPSRRCRRRRPSRHPIDARHRSSLDRRRRQLRSSRRSHRELLIRAWCRLGSYVWVPTGRRRRWRVNDALWGVPPRRVWCRRSTGPASAGRSPRRRSRTAS